MIIISCADRNGKRSPVRCPVTMDLKRVILWIIVVCLKIIAVDTIHMVKTTVVTGDGYDDRDNNNNDEYDDNDNNATNNDDNDHGEDDEVDDV